MARPPTVLLPGLLVLSAFLLGCERGGAAGARAVPDSVRWAEHVAPIVFERCADCHRPGGAAPFSLLEYDSARARGPLIADVTERRFMPPWLPEPDKAEFAGARRLSEAEIATLGRWVEQGMPRGDPEALPPRPEPAHGWNLGPPDQVVTLEEPYVAPAEGHDVYRNLVIPVPGEGTRWVRAVEIRPGNPRVVHHSLLLVDRTGNSRRLDAEDPAPGFDGMMHPGGAESPDGFFVGWTPGKVPDPGDPDMSWRLEEGTDLVLQLHLRPTGEPEEVRPRIGLHFADAPPERIPVVLVLGSRTLDIPAGEPEYVVEDDFTLPVDVEALRIYPHAHYLGKEMRAWAELPDGSERWLLHIREWDFDWQDEYRYAEPVPLPRGTRVRMRFTYDNSAANPRNPNDPPRRVTYGPESDDEMADLILQVLPRNRAERQTLQDAYDTKRMRMEIAGLEQLTRVRPDDPGPHYNLAIALQALDRAGEAVAHYREALRLSPDDARVHNHLASALHETGRTEEAVEHLRRAIALRPGFAEAHHNLATALRAAGRGEEAVRHYRRASELDPALTAAHRGLAEALAERGDAAGALRAWRRAAEAAPDDPEVAFGLGSARAAAGELEGAAGAFRRAAEARPGWAEAHLNLGNALQGLGRAGEAAPHYRRALEARPGWVEAHFNLGIALERTDRPAEAAREYRAAAAGRPDWPLPLIRLGWLLATHPDPGARDASEAVGAAERAVQLTGQAHPVALDALGAAYAAAGRFEPAAAAAARAAEIAAAGGAPELAAAIRERARLYGQGRAYVQPAGRVGEYP